MITLIALFQFLHLAAAIIWIGGQVFMAFSVYPALLELPAPEARVMYARMAKGAGPLMAIAGNVVIVAGVLRGTWLGPLKSLEVLTTSYGIAFFVAVALAIHLAAHGASTDKRVERWFAGEVLGANVPKLIARDRLITCVAFLAILICMMIMRFGIPF